MPQNVCHGRMRLIPHLSAGLTAPLLLIVTTTCALAQQTGPRITGIDLGQSGIALYTFTHQVEGRNGVRLTVPVAHADDVLASLLVRDPAGGVIGLSTATPATVPESLRGTVFAGGLPTSSVELLQALIGSTVRILTPRADVTGAVLGIGSGQDVVGETVIDYPLASLLTAQGTVVDVMIVPGSSVEIPKDAVEPLSGAAKSLGGAQTERSFDLDLAATAPRRIELSYVTEASAWKNSWRLLLEEKRLQGWATFENASGADWVGVDVTLSTGAPVAYRRDLLTPMRIGRLDPPMLMQTRPDVRADSGFAADAAAKNVSSPAPFALAETAFEAAPVSGAAQEAIAVEGIGNVRYKIPQPVDLQTGRTADLLYIDLPIAPEVQALYQPGQSGNVLLAVRLTAEQSLAPGLVSVRDANGFVGDAPFTGLTAGQSRLLPYAAAPGAIVSDDLSRKGIRVDISAAGGTLNIDVRSQISTTYRASLPENIDVFAVEHPKNGTRLIEADGTVEENTDFIRVSKPVEAGTVEIAITEEDVEFQEISADPEGMRQLIAIVTVGDVEIDSADRAVLDQASAITRKITDAERRLDDARASYDALTDDQARLRANLGAVQSDDLRRRYETGLNNAEDEIAELTETMELARQSVREGERDLDKVILQFR